MKLKKHALIILVILVVMFNAVIFFLPLKHNPVFWIMWGGSMVMFAVVAAAYIRAFHRDMDLFSKVLGWPIFKAAWMMLVLQIFLCAVMLVLNQLLTVRIRYAALAEVLLFGIAGIFLITRDAAVQVVHSSERAVQVENNTAQWKIIRAKAAALAESTGNAELKKLAEDMRYADPTPTTIDHEIDAMMDTLSSYATAENIQKARHLLLKRKGGREGERAS